MTHPSREKVGTVVANSSAQAAAIWWTYALCNVRCLYDESISQNICLGDLQPLYSYHLNGFRNKLQAELERLQPRAGATTITVIDGQPSAILIKVAEEAGISLLYLRMLGQTLMCVYKEKVEVNEGPMGIFHCIWQSDDNPDGLAPPQAA